MEYPLATVWLMCLTQALGQDTQLVALSRDGTIGETVVQN